jgi:hypothetical protein
MKKIHGFDYDVYNHKEIERFAISNLIERRLITNFCSIAERLGSGLIAHNQNATVAAMQMAEKKAWAHLS